MEGMRERGREKDPNMSQLMKQQLQQTMSRLERVGISTTGCSALLSCDHDQKFWVLWEKWEMSHKAKVDPSEREEF